MTRRIVGLILLLPLACRAPAPPPLTGTAAIVARFECARCHAASGLLEPAPRSKSCAGCHADILAGRLDDDYKPEAVARWKSHVHHFVPVPSLEGLGRRVRRDWLIAFLQRPHDLRPSLEETMPRLPIDAQDAAAIADHFGVFDAAAAAAAAAETPGDAARGLRLLATRGCGTCHLFGGNALTPSPIPDGVRVADITTAMRLAPDLRHVRERMTSAMVVAWLADPAAIKRDALMPRIPLDEQERRDIATTLMVIPLADSAPSQAPARLPVLARPVAYAEVEDRVFKRICWHCHSDPAPMHGDGGPGNTGGFGFAGRGVDFSSRDAVLRGRVRDDGTRESLFLPQPDGTTRLIAQLMARHAEVVGTESTLRGMPLGLPPLPLEDIQLVETWIAQGAP